VQKQTPEEFLHSDVEEQAFDLFTLAKRAIRGRLPLTLAVTLGLGILFAIIGYSRQGLEYESSVTFNIKSIISIMDGQRLDQDARREDIVDYKKMEFESPDVLLLAVDDPALQAVGWPGSERGASMLKSAIHTDSGRRKAYFTAICRTSSPETAQVALRAVSDAFLKYEAEKNGIAARETELTTQIRDLESNINVIKSGIAAATAEYGTSNLQPRIEQLEYERNQLQSTIEELRIAIQVNQDDSNNDELDEDPDELTPEALAPSDDVLQKLIFDRDQIQSTIDYLIDEKGSRYPEVEMHRANLKQQLTKIESRADIVREIVRSGSGDVDIGEMNNETRKATLNARLQRQAYLDERLREYNAAKESIAEDVEDLDRLQANKNTLNGQLDTLRLNQQRFQEGQVQLLSPPTASKQAKDKRPLLAALGFVAGFMLGLAGIIALGTLKRSFLYVDDLETVASLPPLLGTLPELEKHDPENERIAAVSVHNLRNTLQAIQGFGDNNSVVIACTSAEPGDGKTTLIQSLGASYALTGLRTILVDLDLIGGGMSGRLGLSGRRGIADLLTGLEPTKCIKHTATDKLYAMPIGDTSKCKPEQLANRPIQQVIDWLRERFDVILVDTGPVLGSLEAGIVTAAADQVLLVVARGQSDNIVQAAVGRLDRLGVRSTGIVFNRADPEDLRRSLSAASVGAPSMHQMPRKSGEQSLDLDRTIVGSIPGNRDSRVGTLSTEDETGT
jgi:succinoglycan biosynthesis transport protein ExoP